MSLTWTDLDELARKAAFAKITERLAALSEAERLALAADLEPGIRSSDAGSWWETGRHHPAAGHALAVIGCAPSAARAAALLTRRGMRDGWGQVPARLVVPVAEARGLTWLPDLGVRLAAKLPARETWRGEWQFVAVMLDGSPERAPRTEGFVRGWLAHLHGDRRRPLVDAFRSSPFLDGLFPAVFEIDGLGGALTGPGSEAAFAGAVAQLVAEGRFDRARILAATVDRLVRGDRPVWLRPFAALHDALAPAAAEMAGHSGDYARLLAEAPSAIAGLAQRALRTVDDAGLLAAETLLEAGGAALLRTEKGLVKTQISWLDRVVRREPGRTGEILETVAVAFGHPTLDVQERALTVIGRHAGKVDAGTLERLAGASVVLGGDLAVRAAALFGTTAPAETGPGPVLLTAPAPAAAMPAPIADATELAAEIVALLHDETAVGWERVLAALVALPAGGVDVAGTLRPILERHRYELTDSGWQGRDLRHGLLGDAIRAVLAPARTDGASPPPGALRDARLFGSGKHKSLRGGPGSVLDLRLREVADRITTRPVAELMATPTRVNGSLDAAVLLDRLARAEAQGRQPWPVDLEQALLRVPRDVGAGIVTRAAELTSPAGRQFAGWLTAGGLPDPVSTRFEQTGRDGRYAYGGRPPLRRRIVAQLDQAGGGPGGLLLEEGLTNLARSDAPVYYPDDFSAPSDITAAVLPQHREVTAAWVLPVLASHADIDQRGDGAMLPLLAECSGPPGPALTLAVAYVLGARDAADRLAAVDAFLMLAAGEEDFGAAVGAELADLCAGGTVKLTRVVPALADVHRGGGAAALGQLLAAALPGLLAPAPRGLPDLLELATRVAGEVLAIRVAGETAARDAIPGLAELAARPGGSRLTREARRLHTALT